MLKEPGICVSWILLHLRILNSLCIQNIFIKTIFVLLNEEKPRKRPV
jgi:hypothetical protein